MNAVVAESLCGRHIGRLIKKSDVTGWDGQNFWYAYISHIGHRSDHAVTLTLSIPVDMQDQSGVSNFMQSGHTWQHYMYLDPNEEIMLVTR